MSENDSNSAGGFRIDAALAAKINLADYLNAIPVLREVALINETQREAHALELCVESVPAFLKPKVWYVESIKPGEQYHLSRLDVELDGALLTRLSEAEIATVRFELRHRDKTGEVLARLERTVELLPRNQWGGLSQLPDLVAAFVQPNDPAVERLLKKTAEVLRKHGKDAALNGYKDGGSKRAWELASALWTAVASYGLDYALPPASFEHSGQKVRSPTHVLEAGLGTCFDLALLFCATLEQMGLNPVIVFTTGHAFTGVWLKQEEFSTTVVDDITALRKRVKLNELVLFETTVITERPAPPFTRAVELGAQQIAEENEAKFELAVDIRRARLQRIKPLSGTDAVERKLEKGPDTAVETPFVEAPELPDEDSPEPVPVQDLTPKDRLVRWQRKLLDLSLRNNLLNFRSTKKALKLEAPDPGALEDLLAAGEALKLLPRPDLMDGADPRDRSIYESREHEDVRRAHALDALRRREVFVGFGKEELEARLVDLYRTARTNLQEGGANTLFLALGFLSWTRDDRQGQRYRAPLVLVPVALNRRSVRAGFTLTLHEDEPRFNPTLLEMLRQDFDLHLGVADGDLPKDESGLDVRGIWRTVSAAIKDIKGWEVTEDVVLAPFSFAKYLMWKDLTDRVDQLRENPVVRHLIDSPRESYPPGVPFPDSRRLDREIDPQCILCPLPADSSQLSAVMAAARGKDFVLIGPPGTGKSQTIANLIAHCLAEGNRVLFVSEKIAALDVVYRRLREVGLDDFCLELHSNKARKADVLAQLRRAWEARGHVDPEVWLAEAQRLKRLRDELNTYVERLHHRHSNGMSIFEAIGRVADGRDVPSIELSWGSAGTHSAADLQSMRDGVDRLGVTAQAVGIASIQTHPLAAIGHTEWSPKWQQNVIASARQVLSVAKALRDAYEHFSKLVGLQDSPLDRRARGAVAVLARMLPQAAGHDWSFVARTDLRAVSSRLEQAKAQLIQHRKLSGALSPSWPESVRSACWKGVKLLAERREIHGRLGRAWSPDLITELDKGLALLERIDRCRKELSVRYRQEVEQLNIAQLTHEWAQATASFWPFSWLGKRNVRKALAVHVEDGIELDVGQDLRLLAEIRLLKEQVSGLDLARETDGVWAGLQTRIEFARMAIRFQSALDAARQGSSWEDVGFEAIANGRCGERLRDELERLRALKRLDADLGELSELTSATESLWAGLATNSERLEAALRFQEAVLEVRSKGMLAGEHEVVRRGECGATLARDLEVLRRRSEVERHITSFDDLVAVTAGVWSGLESKVEEIEAALKFAEPVSVAIDTLGNTSAGAAQLCTALERLLSGGATSLASGGPTHSAGRAYLDAWNALQSAIEQLAALGQFSQQAKLEFTELPLAELVSRCEAMIFAEGRLRAWCAWRKVKEEAIGLGLEPLVSAVESGSLTAGQVRPGFETNYARWWLNAAVDEEPVIRNFVSAEHEKRIDDFRKLDERFTELTRALVRAKLCADIPMQDDIARGSEWSVLRYEINKRSRHMPLRELMQRIPTALAKLAPCLLMSPLSIAQYLAPDATSFDLVVFDEASQIPVWDAVGAIARGKQVVMVGDPKQLPPTSFFDRAEVDLDDEDVEADLESILDECLGANLPSMNLSWHYRSKSESLIAFSNHRYYGGDLVTFPSPLTNDRALSFHFVADGVYEKGGARINRKEAQALVADLVGRLKSAEFRESKLTVGVVTFNAEQQALIEDLLDEERRKDPSIEPYFLETEIEPVFVKNLESVQGDERDIMYFSVTYGPDLTGVISMNFGPLNRQGGERRLNVAITRARHELRVFASLRPEQMDLSRTQAIGVRDLKHFLEFAERGPRALAEAVSGSTGGFESPLEESVAKALIGKGWEVHTQVGVSAFRIDIGVVHPDAKGTYLAGVECDGATYHRSATARDRDKLREQMLRRLGWTILRVWSTDWWLDRETTLEKLDSQLRKLLERDRMSRARESMEAESA
jgi:very-short-patch-repair endonuclease